MSVRSPPDEDPRLAVGRLDELSEDNPFFAKALVNRYWKHFFGRGLIEPEDDIRDTNPPTNPELLAALETHFIESGFDLKELVRVITTLAGLSVELRSRTTTTWSTGKIIRGFIPSDCKPKSCWTRSTT